MRAVAETQQGKGRRMRGRGGRMSKWKWGLGAFLDEGRWAPSRMERGTLCEASSSPGKRNCHK
jgi:hypothetical protein